MEEDSDEEKCKNCVHDPYDAIEWHDYCAECVHESCAQLVDNFEPDEEGG